MNEFEKQVQTLESVYPLISKYRHASWLKNLGKRFHFEHKKYVSCLCTVAVPVSFDQDDR